MIIDVYNTCQTILNKNHYGGILSASRFGYLAKEAQLKIFNELVSDWRRARSRELSHMPEKEIFKIEQALAVFSGSANLTNSGGAFALPSDLAYMEDDAIVIDGMILVQKVSAQEAAAIRRSKSITLDEYNPIYVNNGSSVTIYPDTIGKVGSSAFSEVSLSYIKVPNDPVISTTEVGGTQVIDPSTITDFDLPEYYFDKLVVYILEPMGVHLQLQQVEQYAERNENQSYQKDNQ